VEALARSPRRMKIPPPPPAVCGGMIEDGIISKQFQNNSINYLIVILIQFFSIK
jgi:hypothetical protein